MEIASQVRETNFTSKCLGGGWGSGGGRGGGEGRVEGGGG